MKAAPSAARVGNADGTECEQPALAGARWDRSFLPIVIVASRAYCVTPETWLILIK